MATITLFTRPISEPWLGNNSMDFVTLSGANHESYILSVITEHHFIVYSKIVFTHVKLSDIIIFSM